MSSGILALLNRSLRVDARSRTVHLCRLGLIIGIYFGLVQAQITAVMRGAPGLGFIHFILWLDLICLTLIGVSAFSNTITEEKEEDTLGLMQMAGVSPLGLLLGKTGGRLIQTLALLIVQYPFTLLSVTLGGVSAVQVWTAYVSLTAYVVMLSGLGALVSTVSRTSRGAARLMVLLLVLYATIPWICYEQVRSFARTGQADAALPALKFVSGTSIFLQTGEILTTGSDESVWSIQVLSNTGFGIVCFVLAWALFGVATSAPSTEPITRGLLTNKTQGFRLFNPGRPGSNPLIWKDFYFSVGGIAGLLIRTLCYLAILGLVLMNSSGGNWQDMLPMFLMIMAVALPLDASLLVARAMQDEVRGQTIPTLIMLPRSVPSIVYGKLGGALLGLIPGLSCFFIAFACSGLPSHFGATYVLVALFALPYMMLLPHLTAVLALTVRWGATPLAIGSLYAIQSAEGMLFMTIMLVLRSFQMEIYMTLVAITNTALCVGCHFETMRRFRKLAEK